MTMCQWLLRFYLGCLGVALQRPTFFCDNVSVSAFISIFLRIFASSKGERGQRWGATLDGLATRATEFRAGLTSVARPFILLKNTKLN